MNYNLRQIKPEDNLGIKNVILKVSEEYGTYDPNNNSGEGSGAGDISLNDMYSFYNNSFSKYWILEEDSGRVLGGGGFTKLLGSTIEDSICELQKLFLLPEARGKGFGKKILSCVLFESEKLGYKKIYLETVRKMKESIFMYEKMGFKHLNSPLGNTGHFQCSVFMMRDLN